jgi:hypothetical protein
MLAVAQMAGHRLARYHYRSSHLRHCCTTRLDATDAHEIQARRHLRILRPPTSSSFCGVTTTLPSPTLPRHEHNLCIRCSNTVANGLCDHGLYDNGHGTFLAALQQGVHHELPAKISLRQRLSSHDRAISRRRYAGLTVSQFLAVRGLLDATASITTGQQKHPLGHDCT